MGNNDIKLGCINQSLAEFDKSLKKENVKVVGDKCFQPSLAFPWNTNTTKFIRFLSSLTPEEVKGVEKYITFINNSKNQ